METNKKENLSVVIAVQARDYRKGIAVSSMETEAKLKTVFGGIDLERDERSFVIRGTTCSPTIEVDYNSAEIGTGESDTQLEIDVRGKTFDIEKRTLVDGFDASANMTIHHDLEDDKVVEDWFKLKASRDCDVACANVESFFTTKTNDI
jgi:hypothetical protein